MDHPLWTMAAFLVALCLWVAIIALALHHRARTQPLERWRKRLARKHRGGRAWRRTC